MAKRKSPPEDDTLVEPARRRSVRLQKPTDAATVATQPEPKETKAKASTKATVTKPVTKKPATAKKEAPVGKTNGIQESNESSDVAASSETAAPEEERSYWLLKAEPETRFENGVDVKFSIDDLAAKKEPEPWDGIRAYAARNNLRAMKKGELAFFYHSNCKEPGIVGTMEIVQEHSPDLSAHDPKTPYYDPKSKPDDPKWSVVHVKFRSKFAASIGLKELREMGGPGKPLENMQMLKQSRLSVSRVSPAEWEYLMGVAEERASAK